MTDGPYKADEIRLESSLGYYLTKARNVLVERTDRAVKPLGLTAQQIGVILMLSAQRANTPFELSRVMSYDSGSMTRLLDRLEKKGFIVRTRSDADRRMVKLQLTPQGHEAARQLPSLGAAVLNEQLRGFSAAEHATLLDLLGRFIANGIGEGAGGCCGLESTQEALEDSPEEPSAKHGER
ncbi:MarR family winged helix-turn-helix transcriptional regulator [Paraburkholderia fungorum]|jgi:DNA-binding MarR family transcriptional regulator|uniref:DNA-binding MarR family transcriptional regulator n=1 Tax=Paraburkholderia fungorum TaxID=134537 RepID=A0AAW3V3Y7_9BURK|nr:MarR family transcriptional regulator [Paraburkholderia fungorum]MBB4515748.1 DNA-binding MarR family transcriptional regulator [Paraburkholderia fungorum]MBB6203836.1 DNA-binding MarR family transcriptional regulator [Paraburkholderia fungorum]PZR50115.1 MAG: MarR family transcriptional regulator [Paraburkholderia fungorum]QLD48777.1 MarR family transcriptional regulator [Paraburkholderia fungorum]